MTDSKSLFDVITRRQHTTEKRLMIDVAAIRKGFRTRSIANIGLIRSAKILADGLTKRGICIPLHRLLKDGRCSAQVLQYAVEPETTQHVKQRKYQRLNHQHQRD
jgi:hypothetical protein